MNLVSLGFSFLTSTIILGGSLLSIFENHLPVFFVKSFRYGKFNINAQSKLALEVPKSWFKHYYVLAVYIYAYILCMVTCTYMFNCEVPKWFIQFMNLICGDNRIATVSATKVYLALSLLTLQVFRRFYDTHYISVFSKSGRMNVAAYLVGLGHYPGCVLAILCESPKFTDTSLPSISNTFSFANVHAVDILACVVFMWAWWHQHVTTKILADLRKDKTGTVISDSHKVPYGDWFEYLTAPHQTAEIIMYICLTVLLWANFTWFFVLTWVISNQIETIMLSHWWYQEKFEDFPKTRKALIPFIY